MAEATPFRTWNGRDSFEFYSPDTMRNALDRILMETALSQALERGLFELHYQPQHDLASGAICGMEALLPTAACSTWRSRCPSRQCPPGFWNAITLRAAASSVAPIEQLSGLPASLRRLVLAPQKRGNIT